MSISKLFIFCGAYACQYTDIQFPVLNDTTMRRLYSHAFGHIVSLKPVLMLVNMKNKKRDIARLGYNNDDNIRQTTEPSIIVIGMRCGIVQCLYAGETNLKHSRNFK